jgi:hypothetical protein
MDIFGHFAALCSPFDDQLNFFKNYKAVELILAGRCWLYSQIKPQESLPIVAHMDLRRFVGPFQIVDRARDGEHPGPESNRSLAELYWNKFVEILGLESLREQSFMRDAAPSGKPSQRSD